MSGLLQLRHGCVACSSHFNNKHYAPCELKGVIAPDSLIEHSEVRSLFISYYYFCRISGVDLDVWLCETISSALQMPNSVLTELHLINCNFYEGTKILTDALTNCQCKLEALWLVKQYFFYFIVLLLYLV